MLNRLLPYAGAIALALGVAVGCSENNITEPAAAAAATTDPYYVLRPDASAMSDVSELPSLEELIASSGELTTPNANPPDTGIRPGGGKDGRDTGVKPPRDPRDTGVKPPRDTAVKPPKGPRDYGRLQMGTYSRIIKQLQLTSEQDSAVRICFESYRRCVGDAAKTYGAARQALKAQFDAAYRELRSQPKGPERDSAIKALRENYIASVTALNANYDAQVKECQTSFEGCVTSNLTPEQLERWTRLLATVKR
ncbi:MAG: hypothetical protein UZ07_CHB004000573 [Chlorobi bacterium OLB7]|nr:MAG: hypothetical protein UZ07_CHB004000573 [Chlorobi bacterium OLB7]